jgi:hypothetical protein
MEIPHYNTWLPCIHVDYKNGTALVRSFRTGKSFPVHVKKELQFLISRGDRLHVIKSPVSKQWMAIDYQNMRGIRDVVEDYS